MKLFKKARKNEQKEVQEEIVNEKGAVKEQTLSAGKKAKQYGKMILCCLVLLAAAAAVLLMVFREKKTPQVCFYVDADENLYTAEVKKPTKAYVFAPDYDCRNLLIGNELNSRFQFSQDGAYLYYPYETGADGSFKLYVSPYQENGDTKLLDQDVVRYEVIKDEKVVYMKSDGGLYLMNGEEVSRMAASAVDFYVDEKGKSLIWAEQEEDASGRLQFFFGDLELKKERKKLQGGVEALLYVSGDLNTVYFQKDSNLYRIVKQGEKEKLASDILTYFESSYNQEKDSFYYTAKQEGKSVLYYFNGKKSTLIHENIFQVLLAEKGVLMYTVRGGGIKPYVVRETTVARVDIDEALNGEQNQFALIDETTETIYLLSYDEGDEEERTESGSLYAVSYAAENAGMASKVASKAERLIGAAEGSVYYMKDCSYEGSTYQGDLYANQELIAEEAAVGRVYLEPEWDAVFYYTDWNPGSQAGTLMQYKGAKEKKIAENVSAQWIVSEKQIFIFRDAEKDSFTLSYFNGRRVKDIAENVRAFLIK